MQADQKPSTRAITTTYQKRWQVEVFHQSLKLAKSPARRVNAQANHILASIVAVFKIECIKINAKINHFAWLAQLYHQAIRSAFDELNALKATTA